MNKSIVHCIVGGRLKLVGFKKSIYVLAIITTLSSFYLTCQPHRYRYLLSTRRRVRMSDELCDLVP
jgi:hypothetical protein